MVEPPTPISEMEPREFASYPRPVHHPHLAERLEALKKAYYGMGVPFLITVTGAAFLILFGTPIVLSRIFEGTVSDRAFIFIFCSLPALAAWFSYSPMRKLAFGAGWRPWTAVALSMAVALYIVTATVLTSILFPVYTDQPPAADLWPLLWTVLLALTVFPLMRFEIVWQIRRLGFSTAGPWVIRKKLDAEIERLRHEAEPMNEQVTRSKIARLGP